VNALHADASAVLRGWTPPTPAQAELRERYLAHLDTHPDGMQRSCHPNHLTASTLVVTPDASRVLLTLHAKAEQWFQFGGHCEANDATLLGAARREAFEESGIADLTFDTEPLRLDEHEVPFCGDRPGVHHLDVWFLAVAAPEALPAISDESHDVRWWDADALPGDHAWHEAISLARSRLGVG
jgi:8-oxo-dGTP pyrophosphatase MutT (NUDIX family)